MPSHLKRYQTEGSYHFITFSCYRRLPYLNDDPARIVFEEILERLRQRHQFYVFGYVLMPEHVHLLLSEPRQQTLSNTLPCAPFMTASCHEWAVAQPRDRGIR